MPMQTLPFPPLLSLAKSRGTADASTARTPRRHAPPAIGSRHRLAELQQRLAESGGLVAAEAFIGRLRARCDQPLSLLARWIVDRRVLSVDAGGQRWLPLFQFEPHSLRVLDGVDRALAELRGVFDEDELVEWFATPNGWLADRSPASLAATDAAAVAAAARADRFVAAG